MGPEWTKYSKIWASFKTPTWAGGIGRMGQGDQGHLLGSRTPPCGKEAFLSSTDLPQGWQDVLQRANSWQQEMGEAAPLYLPSGAL